MTLRRDLLTLLATSAIGLTGCVDASMADKTGDEEDAPIDGAFDSFRSPTDHGALAFGEQASASLTADEGFHTWTFELSSSSDVALRTERATPTTRPVDTVLYLYREGPRGWGRALTSNDDTGGTLFSGISRTLEAGRYRALVKGYQRSTRGRFGIVAECTGAGCSPAVIDACVLGDRFGAVPESLRLLVGGSSTHSIASELAPLHVTQLVRAVNDAGHPAVTTAEGALAVMTDHRAERFEIYDGPGGRAFTAWRFVLGDHYFGAVFEAGTATRVTRIVDDEITECTVGFELCTLGSTYRRFRDGSLAPVSARVLTSATGLSTTRTAQLVRAVTEAYEEVRTATDAFAAVDGGEINEVIRRDPATGRTFVAFEYGAGDNSYGAIFEGEAATPVGRVRDGDMYGCTAFSPAPPLATEGQDCSRASQCAEDLLCRGVAEDEGVGRCAGTADIEGDGLACSASVACATGLVCSGITRGPEGICRPAWMRGSYASSTRVVIPDNSAAGVSSSVLVYGLATVDTDVEVTARIQHARSTDLRVVLVNAAGTEQPVWDGATQSLERASFEIRASVPGSGDESVTGHWTLRVIDSRAGTTGALESWSLTVTSRWD